MVDENKKAAVSTSEKRQETASISTEFNKAEADLHNREIKYRSIFEQSNDAIMVIDFQKGTYVESNPTAQTLTGYTQEEFLELKAGAIFPKERKSEFLFNVSQMNPGRGLRSETEIQTKDGRRIPVGFSASIIRIDSIPCMVIVMQDISINKNVEEALKDSEYNLSQAQRITQTGSFEWNFKTGLLKWSNELYRIYGVDSKTFKPTTESFIELVHPDDRKSVLATINDVSTSQKSSTFEFRIIRPGGAVRTVLVQTKILASKDFEKPFRILGTTQDITERKAMGERVLIQTRALAQIGEAIILVGNNQHILYINIAAGNQYEMDPGQAVGRHLNELFIEKWENENDKDKALSDFQEKGVWSGENIHIKGNGSEIIVHSTVSKVKDDNGRQIGVLWATSDITTKAIDRQRIESLNRFLTNRTEELMAANNELKAFSYSISHDLRNPLNAIITCAEILSMEAGQKLDPDSRTALSYISKSANRMSQVITDLLTLSSISRQEMKKESVDISCITNIFAEELKTSNPHREVVFSIQPGIVVNADPGFIRILLENLLRNAYKFTSGKNVALIEFGAKDSDRGRDYYIKDNGVGFDMADADKLFKPYHRLHSQQEFKGSGIGLAIAKRIVEKHGGTIWAQSEKNNGATFFFCLP